MNPLKFHNNYSINPCDPVGTISAVTVLYKASTDVTIGHLVPNIAKRDFVFIAITTTTGYSSRILDAISCKLKKLNKPAYKAPPTGFYKCVACGVEVPIKEVPYEEQAACPDHCCDGQVFCNEYKGWNHDRA